MLAGTGSELALGDGAAALGEAEADGVGVALGDAGAIPPWPPLGDEVTFAAGLPDGVAFGEALPDGVGDALPDGVGVAAGGAATAPLPSAALSTLRKRSSAALPTSSRFRFSPGRR
ncbi:hypothetical protein GCM10027614_76560 [Micromonospora vulcania]